VRDALVRRRIRLKKLEIPNATVKTAKLIKETETIML
jgi:hypothetical protein